MFTWTYSTISVVNSETLRTFLAIKIGCHFWLVSTKLSRKWNHIESNNHLGIHMVRFCYHNDPRKNHVSTREAWSISDWEGSSHVHVDVTCTSRVLLERIVRKHRYLEKYIASKVFKVALISINIVTLNLELKATSFWMTYTTSLKHMLHLHPQLPALPE